MRRLRILWITLVAVVADQASKIVVAHRMVLGSTVCVLGDFLRLAYIRNPKAAFSIALGSRAFHMTAASVAMALILAVLWRSQTQRRLLRAGLALILGGAIGNLIDRIRLGEVIDFIDVDFFNIHLHWGGVHLTMNRWPVFNVADAAVTVGVVLLVAVYAFAKEAGEVHGRADSVDSARAKGTQTP